MRPEMGGTVDCCSEVSIAEKQADALEQAGGLEWSVVSGQLHVKMVPAGRPIVVPLAGRGEGNSLTINTHPREPRGRVRVLDHGLAHICSCVWITIA